MTAGPACTSVFHPTPQLSRSSGEDHLLLSFWPTEGLEASPQNPAYRLTTQVDVREKWGDSTLSNPVSRQEEPWLVTGVPRPPGDQTSRRALWSSSRPAGVQLELVLMTIILEPLIVTSSHVLANTSKLGFCSPTSGTLLPERTIFI